MTFEEFRQQYIEQHPASIPERRVVDGHPRWLYGSIVAMFVCAALLSGVHTVPTVRAGIEVKGIVTNTVADAVALSSFLAVELAILVSGYVATLSRRLSSVMIVIAFIIAIVANVSSVQRAFEAQALHGNVDVSGGEVIVAVVLGIGAPLMALLAGVALIALRNDLTRAAERADQTYAQACLEFDAKVNTAWTRATRGGGQDGRTRQLSASERTGQTDMRPASGEPSPTGYGYERTPDAQQKALEYFANNPDKVNLPLRTLEGLIGVGKSTVGEARKEWQRQQQLASSVSSNGHGEAS